MNNDSALLDMPGAVIDTLKQDKDSVEVNYRYATDPLRSCGMCIHFKPPGGCELVLGVIRSVDTCNLFEPKPDGGRTQSQLVPWEPAEDLAYPGPSEPQEEPAAEPVQAQVKLSPVQAELVGHAGRPDLAPVKKPDLKQVQAEVSEGFGPQQPRSRNLADKNFSDNKEAGSKKQRKWLKTAVRSGGKFIGRGGSHKPVQATEVMKGGAGERRVRSQEARRVR
jgi:hypothetical protein